MDSISIQYVKTYGERGSLVGEFEYPKGLSCYGELVVVCDTQNNRIQVTDSITSNEYGVGELYFPHSVVSDGTYFYVSDMGNHRIVVYDLTWNIVTSYGIEGSGNTEFEYPSGISLSGNYIYVADRQNNRIQKLLKSDGTFVDELTGLLLPEDVCVIDDKLYVLDSGNSSIKKYDLDFNFIKQQTSVIEGYATKLQNIQGVLCCVDFLDFVIYFLDSNLEVIRSLVDDFYFPEGVVICGADFIVSQPHELKYYSINIEFGLQYVDDIIGMTKQLYPTGRAFWMKFSSIFNKLHEGLALSESRLHSSIINMQNSLIADNYQITDLELSHWESVYGVKSNGTKNDRIKIIKQRMSFPGNILARQNANYIEEQLQLAGFNVNVIYDGAFNPFGAIYGSAIYGNVVYGEDEGTGFSICANNIQESRDSQFSYYLNGLSLFHIGGENLYEVVDIPELRKNEFRDLILTLKPAHSVAVLYINYI